MFFFWYKQKEEPVLKEFLKMQYTIFYIFLICLHNCGIFFAMDRRSGSNIINCGVFLDFDD